MPTPRKRRAAAVPQPQAEQPDAAILRQLALQQHQAQKLAWLRTQFVAWWAELLEQITHLENELETNTDLAAALGADRRDVSLALGRAWSDLAAHGPRCVPAFLKVMPAFFPKPSTEGV